MRQRSNSRSKAWASSANSYWPRNALCLRDILPVGTPLGLHRPVRFAIHHALHIPFDFPRYLPPSATMRVTEQSIGIPCSTQCRFQTRGQGVDVLLDQDTQVG